VIGTLRVGCGAPALFAVHFQEEEFAATLITLGFITDGIDGPVARKLGVSSEFGASHDYFANYLCYIVAQKVS
jgi:phosphatidylserine synthase